MQIEYVVKRLYEILTALLYCVPYDVSSGVHYGGKTKTQDMKLTVSTLKLYSLKT